MADNAVQFELVSPEKLLLSEDVEMVVVPGVEGDFGVLPGHAPMISTVRPAEEAVALDDIDRASVEKDLQDANDDIRDAGGDATQLALAEARAATARAKIVSLDNLVYQ